MSSVPLAEILEQCEDTAHRHGMVFLLPSVQRVARPLGVGLDKFIPFTGFHCCSVNLCQIVLIKLRLLAVSVATLDDTSPLSLLFKIFIYAHGGKVVAGLEYALLKLTALVRQGERL